MILEHKAMAIDEILVFQACTIHPKLSVFTCWFIRAICIYLPRARAMQVSKVLVSSLSFIASEVIAGRNCGLDSSEGKTLFELVML